MTYRSSGYVCAVTCTSILAASPGWTAPPTEGLVLHLDATRVPSEDLSPEGTLLRWTDISGNGHHVLQSDPGARPQLLRGALNGLPAVSFTGTEYLDGPPVLPEGDMSLTIVAVWRREGEGPIGEVVCEQADDGPGRRASLLIVGDRYGFNGQNNDQHQLVRYEVGLPVLTVLTLSEDGMVRIWHNDERTGTGAGGRIDRTLQNTGARRFRVGDKETMRGEGLRGQIGEILIYDRVLTFEEIAALNLELGTKWGIGVPNDDGSRSVYTMPIEEIDRGPDYTSRVPRFTFGESLEEQETQLRDNPLLARFAASRRALAHDRYRPLYHFVSPESGMNDPNGLCYWQGRWHLFYQAFPPEDPRLHWGHAVSSDLVRWRDLPYAIYPHPERDCFSGATFVEEDRVIAMYHGTERGNMAAISHDPLLLNWEKVTGDAVIPIRNADGSLPPYNVFDPCVWKQGDYYYSLSAGTIPGPGNKRVRADFLLRSPDLEAWEYLHPFAEKDYYTLVGDDGACPYFWPIGDKHMLLHYSHMSGGKYLLGTYDTERQKLVVEAGGDFNFGASNPGGVHAPSACPDGEGGIIVIFNMNPAKPTPGWDQIMSLPRRLSLDGPDDLRMEPAGDLAALREQGQSVEETVLPANEEIVLEGVSGDAMELAMEIDPGAAPMVELCVLRSPDREEYTRIAFYPRRGFHYWNRGGRPGNDSIITLDNSRSSTSGDVLSRPPESAPVYLPDGEPLRLHVFIDRSIVEVFVNGRQCVAARVFPERVDSVGVSLRAQGAPATLRSLQAWQMRSIYGRE